MTTWTVGDRVVCVEGGSFCGSYTGLQGVAGKVTKVAESCPASEGGLIAVLFDNGDAKTMFGRRLQREVPKIAVGDRVRVVTMEAGFKSGFAVGDELTVTTISGNALSGVTDDGRTVSSHWMHQFAKVAGATAVAPAVEYVKLPNGSVVVVDKVTAGGAKLAAGDYWDPSRLTPADAPKPLPEVPSDADTMLRMVDVFLSRNDTQARRLQSVLAALRGPDEAGVDKASTTIPIRRAALPECAKVAAMQWLGSATNMDFNAKPLDLGTNGGHFGGHIQSAATALRAMGREVK